MIKKISIYNFNFYKYLINILSEFVFEVVDNLNYIHNSRIFFHLQEENELPDEAYLSF